MVKAVITKRLECWARTCYDDFGFSVRGGVEGCLLCCPFVCYSRMAKCCALDSLNVCQLGNRPCPWRGTNIDFRNLPRYPSTPSNDPFYPHNHYYQKTFSRSLGWLPFHFEWKSTAKLNLGCFLLFIPSTTLPRSAFEKKICLLEILFY